MTPADRPWALYDALIAGVPDGITVTDAVIAHWCLVSTDAGTTGLAMTYRGGPHAGPEERDVVGKPLREVAVNVKSWNLEMAALGAAALNAWYNTPERLDRFGPSERGVEANTFSGRSAEHYSEGRTVVVGRFGGVDRFRSDDFVVLERQPEGADLPDPACEFVIPGADRVLITATTLINKTLPRLLQLAAGAETTLIGPSTVLAPDVFAGPVNKLAGAVVTDPKRCRRLAAVGASGKDMVGATEMYTLPLRRSAADPTETPTDPEPNRSREKERQ